MDAFSHIAVSLGRNDFVGRPIFSAKVGPLDTKYPNKCFKCKKDSHFHELLNRNASIGGIIRRGVNFYDYKEYKKLKKMWKSKYVQFYCCFCFADLNRKESKLQRIREQVLLGEHFREQIQEHLNEIRERCGISSVSQITLEDLEAELDNNNYFEDIS